MALRFFSRKVSDDISTLETSNPETLKFFYSLTALRSGLTQPARGPLSCCIV
jgi:hypothetical protein